MNRLVSDLLSLSRVQAEERRRPSDQVDLPLLLRGVLATMDRAAQAAGVTVETQGLGGSQVVPGDPDQHLGRAEHPQRDSRAHEDPVLRAASTTNPFCAARLGPSRSATGARGSRGCTCRA